MTKNEPTKKIKILTNGPITALGYIWGPVLTPYNEKVSNIFKLLSNGVKVVEVTDGGDVELTVQNYQKDNSKTSKEAEDKAKEAAEKAAKDAEAKKLAEEQAKKEAEEAKKLAEQKEAERVEEFKKTEEANESVDETPVKNDRDKKYRR